jgi:outer membrane protein insertion porin family
MFNRGLFSLILASCVVAVFFDGSLFAQQPARTPADGQPVVNELRIEYTSVRTVSEGAVRASIQLREGMPYSPAMVDQSVRALYATGLIEFVEVSVVPLANNKVDVIFSVAPKYRVGQVRFEGNDRFSNRRMNRQIEMEAGNFLDDFRVASDAQKIRDYYVDKGFPDAEVDFDIERNRLTGTADVTFEIHEGGRVRIAKVLFEGNDSISDRRLRRSIKTKRRTLLSFLTGTGRFDEVQFEADLEILRNVYRNQGFLDVRVRLADDGLYVSNRGRMTITLKVEEGERYYVGGFEVSGNTIFTDRELLGAHALRTGDPFSPEAVDRASGALTDYYTSRGYLDAFIRAERIPNLEDRSIDLNFIAVESEKFYLESIRVQGNTKTKSNVIIRELALRPGDVFDLVRMRTSQQRLRNTRFFEEVNLTPEPSGVPGRRDLSITVQEGRTGNLTFGAGFSSLENVVIFAEVSQSNFDLFNWRSRFQGAGQKFRIRTQLGRRSNEVLISFEEPWLFQQQLAFGVDIFRVQTNFNSSFYNEVRLGFETFLRRRLFELVEGRLSYRLEQVDIFDVDAGAPAVILNARGTETVSKVGFSLLRDTRDSMLFTRKGNRTQLLTEVAGGPFGADVNYYRLEGRTAQFIPTFESMNQNVSLIGRIGAVDPFGSSAEVPFYDRYYLGGPDSLRGFDFREASPRDAAVPSEPIGGNSFAFASVEYTFQLAPQLAIATFYDWGFVNASSYDFDISRYRDNWGVGLRLLVMGSPLKLDLGFPITTRDDDGRSAQFHFSFGTRF